MEYFEIIVDAKTGKETVRYYTQAEIDAFQPTIEQLRASASMPRSRFILAALDAGILSETDAEQAVNGWPTGWDTFFESKTPRERIAAKAEWASITTVRRNALLIEQLRVFKNLTPEQIDQMFGIGD